jgi:two-component sensor histidine kinase
VRELAVHALSRGALRTGTGRIRIGWTVQEDGEGRELAFDWEEEDAAAATGAPALPVLEKTLAYEMNARTLLLPRPHGFACRILLPFSPDAFASA